VWSPSQSAALFHQILFAAASFPLALLFAAVAAGQSAMWTTGGILRVSFWLIVAWLFTCLSHPNILCGRILLPAAFTSSDHPPPISPFLFTLFAAAGAAGQ
jgi:hypothetical protein